MISPSAIGGTVSAPPSKSYTHRAVIIGALARGETVVESFLSSDDTQYTINACRALGVDIRVEGTVLKIVGTCGRLKPTAEPIFVGNSGSTMRMVASLTALVPGRIVLDGEPRLRERPVGDLLSALNRLGVAAVSVNNNGCPPIEIRGGRLLGGEVSVSGETSSQHISSLLMAAPYAEKSLVIRVTDRLRSRPYVDITIDVMREFGVKVENSDYKEFRVRNGQKYEGRNYHVEGDYSSAACFFAAAAIGQSPLAVGNLNPDSAQGDRRFLDILAKMGCRIDYAAGQFRVSRSGELNGITVDMGDYPDIVQPLAVVAAYARGKTKITNIGHLRHKETDRIENTAAELGKMGIMVEVTKDTMTITGGRPKGAIIEAHNDHRMAMSLAIAALFAEGDTIIDGAEAVAKSYPDFFTDLAKIGGRIGEID